MRHVLTIALVVASSWYGLDRYPPQYEDDPRWDCTVHGNRVCGVPGPDGDTYLVHHDEDGKPTHVTVRG